MNIMKNQHKILIVGLLTLGIAAGLMYWSGKGQNEPKPGSDGQTQETPGSGTNTSETAQVDPKTLDWLIFVNEKGTLRFSRPAEWQMRTLGTKNETYAISSPEYEPIVSGTTEIAEVYVMVHENPAQASVKQYFSTFDDASRLWFDTLAYEEIEIGGRQAYVFPDVYPGDYIDTRYIVDCPKRIVSLSFNHETDRNAAVVEAMAKSIACE